MVLMYWHHCYFYRNLFTAGVSCTTFGPRVRIRPARRFYPAREALLITINLMDSCHCNITVRFASGQQSMNITKITFDRDFDFCRSSQGKADRQCVLGPINCAWMLCACDADVAGAEVEKFKRKHSNSGVCE